MSQNSTVKTDGQTFASGKMTSRKRSSKSTLRISIEKTAVESEVSTIKSSLDENSKDENLNSIRTLIKTYIANFEFTDALKHSQLLINQANSTANDIFLFARALFLNQEFRSSLFWIQRSGYLDNSEVSKSLYEFNVKSPMSSMSPWANMNIENEFNRFNLSPKSRKKHLLNSKTKLFSVDEEKKTVINEKCYEATILAVKCLRKCNEDDQALEIIDKLVFESEIEQIISKAKESSNQKIIFYTSRLCFQRGDILLRKGRNEESIFYLKAAIYSDPNNLSAIELLTNDQLSSTEAYQTYEVLEQYRNNQALPSLYNYKKRFLKEEELEGKKLLQLGKHTSALKEANKNILDNPYNLEYQIFYIEVLVASKQKAELYYYAHQCSQLQPSSVVSFFAIGCYYFLLTNYSEAGKYFRKATLVDKFFKHGWIYFGKCFAEGKISDKALAIFELSATIFIGCHLFPLAIAIEYQKQNNTSLTKHYLFQAFELKPSDPIIASYLGSFYLSQQNFQQAEVWFSKVFTLCESHLGDENVIATWSGTICNYGHCLRRLNRFKEAITLYKLCLSVDVTDSVLSSIGLCYFTMFKAQALATLGDSKANVSLKTQKQTLERAIKYLRQAVAKSGSIDNNLLDNALVELKQLKREINDAQDFGEGSEDDQADCSDIDRLLEEKLSNMSKSTTSENQLPSFSTRPHSYFRKASDLNSKLDFSLEDQKSYTRSLELEDTVGDMDLDTSAFDVDTIPGVATARERGSISPIPMQDDFDDLQHPTTSRTQETSSSFFGTPRRQGGDWQ